MSDAAPAPTVPAPSSPTVPSGAAVAALLEQQLAVTLALSLHSAAAHVQSALTLGVAASTRALELALSTPAGDDRVGATLDASRRALEVSLDHLRSATSHAAALIAQLRAVG